VRFAIKHVCPVQLMEADEQPHAGARWQTVLDWFALELLCSWFGIVLCDNKAGPMTCFSVNPRGFPNRQAGSPKAHVACT
jgi:hypothetical protein